MDIERVRSLFAQMEEGLIESTQKDSGAEQRIEGGVQGKVPWLATAEVSGSVLWNRRESETRTLHDHMFNYVEKRLCDSGTVVDINTTYTSDTWSRDNFIKVAGPTSFLKVTGNVRLNDFGEIASLLRDSHELGRIISSFTVSGQMEGRSKHAKQQQQESVL